MATDALSAEKSAFRNSCPELKNLLNSESITSDSKTDKCIKRVKIEEPVLDWKNETRSFMQHDTVSGLISFV